MTTNVNPVVLAASAQLTESAVAYITGALNGLTIIKSASFSNVTPGSVSFTVYRVASGGTPGVTNILIDTRPIPAAPGTDLAPELTNMVLNPGDTIQCLASATGSLNFTASGFFAT
jgi:hypothetical protein